MKHCVDFPMFFFFFLIDFNCHVWFESSKYVFVLMIKGWCRNRGLISLLLGAVQEEREEEGVMVDAEQGGLIDAS